MPVTFIRHGQSTANAGIPALDVASIPLTDLGREQAEALAASWAVVPLLIAVSPFQRTQLTAAPTMRRFPQVPVEVLPMQEFSYLQPGRWTGTSYVMSEVERYWTACDSEYCDGPGAESFSMLLRRVERTLARLAKLPESGLVLAFSHGHFMQAVRLSLLHPEWTDQRKMERFWDFDSQHPFANAETMQLRRTAAGVWNVEARLQAV